MNAEGDGLLVGLEVHQQLSTPTKLFCACPVTKSDSLPYGFSRRLRPAQSETGRFDPAALFEFTKGKAIAYRWSPESSCLVDADEEPPHEISPEAVDTAILISTLLHSSLVDEAHVMRKIVIDGSNPSGFQRTVVIGLGGWLEVSGVRVGVQSVTLEEDAARNIGEGEGSRGFALDRVGIPLVEVALDPVSGTPEFIGKVALHLGRILRSTGRVARGLGTIRQDLNVSYMGGAVVEVKGVQKLPLIAKVVAYEKQRQSSLTTIASKVPSAAQGVRRVTIHDVTEALTGSGAPAVKRGAGQHARVLCLVAPGLAGLFGFEPLKGFRLGREVAQVARASGLGGVIHSDEFGKQGITPEEETTLRKEVGAGGKDALVLVVGPAERVERVAEAVAARIEMSSNGVPAETRGATEDGETVYMRPRPGSQRMYPETDIPQIRIVPGRIAAATKSMPESWETAVERLTKQYSLSVDLSARVLDSGLANDFEKLAKELKVEPSVIASTMVELPVRLSREGISEDSISTAILEELLRAIASGTIAKEAAPDVLRAVGRGDSKTVSDSIRSLGLGSMNEDEVEAIVDSVLNERAGLLKSKGEGAFSPLMGEVMAKVRGRADGAVVGRLLRERMKDALSRSG